MGTAVSIHVIGESDDETAAAVAGCVAELRDIESVFSPFRRDSDISRIRRGELRLENADPRVAHVEARCVAAAAHTGGLFDAWWRGWFDPTGFVKGWAVDVGAARHLAPLTAHPQLDAVGIGAGGDLRLFTAPSADWIWRIGIADPDHPGGVLATVEVRDGAVATSGTAERGAHIIDPRSGEPATAVRSATVLADDLTTADVWATAAVVAGDLRWITQAPTTAGMLVAGDGSTRRWVGGVEVAVVAGSPLMPTAA
ncbi:FAD:protein FMN transferase [Microbacterium elymi]|uniref:FAD:protein FMN transferase n=1 Tax=Microbacterium elymi TaxID=2909587 RepID=A0ABY5NI91_9MICO|nr:MULTISPECIES: FAD:protein FMN transferase [Microbacterium]UUT34846.1 FAD:protein FMN transferase [Microbacterium elymi]